VNRRTGPQDIYEQIGQAIAHHRGRAGLSQAAVAASIGLTRTSISNIEKGRQKMLVHTLLDIARTLSVAPADLVPAGTEQNDAVRFSGTKTSPAERATISALIDTLPGSLARRSGKGG